MFSRMSFSCSDSPALIIGDSHGHYDRLAALLYQEGFLRVHAGGLERNPDNDAVAVHVGDVVHAGFYTQPADRTIAEQVANRRWVDQVVWGNHDRAIIDLRNHGFNGFSAPFPETVDAYKLLEKEDRIHLALAVHGFLITHAGLSSHYETLPPDEVAEAAAWLNSARKPGDRHVEVIDAISYVRRGPALAGGILWRSMTEDLSSRFNQIFGHTTQAEAGQVASGVNDNGTAWYNIDVGDRANQTLAGLWLPDRRPVMVNGESAVWKDRAFADAVAALN
jgi:hypothetical protein